MVIRKSIAFNPSRYGTDLFDQLLMNSIVSKFQNAKANLVTPFRQ